MNLALVYFIRFEDGELAIREQAIRAAQDALSVFETRNPVYAVRARQIIADIQAAQPRATNQ